MTIQLKSWVPSSTIDTDAVMADGKDLSASAAGDGQDNFAGNKSSAFEQFLCRSWRHWHWGTGSDSDKYRFGKRIIRDCSTRCRHSGRVK